MGFSRQEYWSGLPFPSPGDLPNPGIEPGSPALQADSLPSESSGKLRTTLARTKSLVLSALESAPLPETVGQAQLGQAALWKPGLQSSGFQQGAISIFSGNN